MKKLIIAATIILSGLSTISCLKRGISVHIRNSSEYMVNELTMEFTGGTVIIPDLPTGKKTVRRINSAGESSLIISYRIGKNIYTQKADIYFEQNYRGDIFITITDKGKIIIDYDIRS